MRPLVREFVEEAGNITDPAQQARFQQLTEDLFASVPVADLSCHESMEE